MSAALAIVGGATVSACGWSDGQGFVPAEHNLYRRDDVRSNREYFQIFMSGGPWPVAMTPGPNGELWFSACNEGARGPCEVGYYTPALHQVVVAKHIPFVQSLVYGPDKNIWFTSGTGPNRGIVGQNPVVGRIDRQGHVTTFIVRPDRQQGTYSEDDIINGPQGRLWFDDTEILTSITTAGVMTRYNTEADTTLGQLLAVGNRIVFSGVAPDTAVEPICALDPNNVTMCYRMPEGKSSNPYSFFFPIVLYDHRIVINAICQGCVTDIYLMSEAGAFTKLKDQEQITPIAATNKGDLVVRLFAYDNPGFAIAHISGSALVGTKYYLSPSDTQYECYASFKAASTTDGYVWLLGKGAGGGHSCLMRFRERQ